MKTYTIKWTGLETLGTMSVMSTDILELKASSIEEARNNAIIQLESEGVYQLTIDNVKLKEGN